MLSRYRITGGGELKECLQQVCLEYASQKSELLKEPAI